MKILCVALVVPFLFSCASTAPPGKMAAAPSTKEAKVGVTLAKSKQRLPAKAAEHSVRSLQPYQFSGGEDVDVVYLRVVTDRTGKRRPVFDNGREGETAGHRVALRWLDVPGGVDYHEEILGAYHGRKILSSSYHWTDTGKDDKDRDESTFCLLSIEDGTGALRPFLSYSKDPELYRSMEIGLSTSPSGELTGVSKEWELTGNGLYHGWANIEFRPDGPHLKETGDGGRRIKTVTRTYNAAGKVIRTKEENG